MRHYRHAVAPPDPQDTPAPSEAIALFALSMALLLGLGSPLLAGLGLLGSALSQLLFIAGPTLLFAQSRRGRAAWRWLGVVRVRPRALGAAALIGASFWFLNLTLVVPLSQRWLGGEQALRELERIILPANQPLWVPLLAVVLLPAVCEELLFRGTLARALRPRLGVAGAVAVSALLFGAFHIVPARIPPTAVFGAALAYATLATGSVLPGIVMHLLNNAITVLLAGDQIGPVADAIAQHPGVTGATAIVMTATGFALLATGRTQGESGSS